MTKEEIIKELDELGNVLYNKFGTDSYLERCTIHDLKAKIKALIIADVSQAKRPVCPHCVVVGQSEQLKPNPITDKEHKDLMKALYPKDNSKRFRR